MESCRIPGGARHPSPLPGTPDPRKWRECRWYLFGLDLFNHGYYWEAHEAWEALWHACGRYGELADFFKGLIQLAVAGVKVRERRPEGVRAHAKRAAELFQSIATTLSGGGVCMGLRLNELIATARQIGAQPPEPQHQKCPPVEVVFPFVLLPEARSGQ